MSFVLFLKALVDPVTVNRSNCLFCSVVDRFDFFLFQFGVVIDLRERKAISNMSPIPPPMSPVSQPNMFLIDFSWCIDSFTKRYKLVHNGRFPKFEVLCCNIDQDSVKPLLRCTVFQITKFQVS